MSTLNGFGLAGIIGMPVAHSRSPTIHNFWLNAHGIRGAYVPLAVQPERLNDALPGLVALGFRGCNVTMPHKQTAMPLLHRVNETARRIGAVNTIVVEEDGTLSGFNNDGNGFVQSLRDAKPDWRADEGPILLLGAGAALKGCGRGAAGERRAADPDHEPHRREGTSGCRRVRPDRQRRRMGGPQCRRGRNCACWSTARTRA